MSRKKSQYQIEKEANDRPFKERLAEIRKQKRKAKPVAIDLDSDWKGWGDYHLHAVVIWDQGGLVISIENGQGKYVEIQLQAEHAKRFLQWAVKAKAEVEARHAVLDEANQQEAEVYREWEKNCTEKEKAERAKREVLQKSAKAKLTEAEIKAVFFY